jgi:hypothetical protein
MFSFSHILTDLQAVIAVHAARNRALTVLLVALWGRIARMRTRLERLVALWRAGQLPPPRAPRVGGAAGMQAGARRVFPSKLAWLTRMLGYEVAAFGGQLRHLMTDAECVAFLAAVPQAGRILRPLLRMLSIDPLPEVILPVRRAVPEAAPVAEPAEPAAMVGIVVSPGFQFSGA